MLRYESAHITQHYNCKQNKTQLVHSDYYQQITVTKADIAVN
jgi:hypothetical protein